MTIIQGDCIEVLKTLPDCSVDAVVTDPPYGLSFMGKRWDYDVPSETIWAECLRVLKPGGHLLAFAGTRTQHRMAVRIEDAGFEIRDMIAWVYGCLDEQTKIATKDGVKPYHKTRIGDTVLCYNTENGEYSYQPILEIVEYDYSDTAYRLIGDFGEQVVSRNHRVIVERDGKEIFALAEQVARQQQVRVPILESLPELRQAISDAQQGASETEQDVQLGLCECADWQGQYRGDAAGSSQGQSDNLRGLRCFDMEAGRMASQSAISNVQPEVQRQVARTGLGETRVQRAFELDASIRGGVEGQDDGRNQPGMEGRSDVSQPQGRILQSGNQVCALPTALAQYGTQGRLCYGVSTKRSDGAGSAPDALGVRPPHQPRRNGQSVGKPDAVQHQRRAQGVRAWRGHTTAVVRVVPFRYTGKVWCLRVPTGAFVAVRNGVAFPTGNSGFPKSHDVSKAIDRAAGAEREVVGRNPNARETLGTIQICKKNGTGDLTAPATDAARQWDGWGTALKPAMEMITMARKPLSGTVAANVLTHGTGALNVDGCRVGTEVLPQQKAGQSQVGTFERRDMVTPQRTGRWPANLIHDGSAEVVGLFPETKSGGENGNRRGHGPLYGDNTYGNYNPKKTTDGIPPDTGSAARFFYCAKASKRDRDEGCEGLPVVAHQSGMGGAMPIDDDGKDRDRFKALSRNHHPTVKPTDLMRYLVRLVTSPGGVVLDPFMGSGSTGKACALEGFNFIGIEREAEYVEIARARIAAVSPEPVASVAPTRHAPAPKPAPAGQLSLFDEVQT